MTWFIEALHVPWARSYERHIGEEKHLWQTLLSTLNFSEVLARSNLEAVCFSGMHLPVDTAEGLR